MVSNVNTFGICGLNGFLIQVETDLSRGIPVFDIVGLGDTSVREARERVRSAIRNQGFEFPISKITINLAPASKKKEGAALDLAVAIGILSSMGLISEERLRGVAFSGELSLDGSLRKISGILPMAVEARKCGFVKFIVPRSNKIEASMVDGIEVAGFDNLRQVVSFILGESSQTCSRCTVIDLNEQKDELLEEDFIQVSGQPQTKRALEIAASGGHNMIMMGAAGCGKTMMARRMGGIMPALNFEQSFEVTSIYSVAGLLDKNTSLIRTRPFRTVHSGITSAALVGGGRPIRPGEISLAHNGLLFLDEMSEIDRRALECLRQPLEEGKISISRLGYSEMFPANFMLIGASNPCKCGMLFEGDGKCTCTPLQLKTYLSRISKPILDRIDLLLPIHSVKYNSLSEQGLEASWVIRKRVERARIFQQERYQKNAIKINSKMTRDMLEKYCKLGSESKELLEKAVNAMDLSVRGYEKIIKVARTIADMECLDDIGYQHIAEALQYRSFNNKGNLYEC